MTTYRTVVPADGRVFVEGRCWFPWPHWRRAWQEVFTPFDIELRPIDFATVEDSQRWVAVISRTTAASAVGISRSEMDQALPHPSSPQGEQA